ncbi:bifunctional acetate--CoA ligase family protein/GNAT family N-acetyltransferase [Roseovarius amoyensis]|uniref:bifunctional acetate--CoA ligase family protein/GNAT family N-acetyltransferase n=1 Tax=Roseovarius amoyensis TaxID=2211448 RepID=UPI000DBE2E20|nr:bifunctional acetate--CoA ligase family protein/GNAT family N-acetyltransferase [Roseovarius amoyensis]
MDSSPLTPMFDPKSVAVFGASDSPDSVGGRVFTNIRDSGFKGDIYPINPRYETVAGVKCLSDIAQLPKPVDLAVIATPADTVPGIITQCGMAGTAHAIVLSAGFGEGGGPGNDNARKLTMAARKAGVRVMGPNCVGLVRPWIGLDATFLRSHTPKGGLALVSQSGALCSAIADWSAPHHLGFSALVSLGNSLDIDFGDVLHFLADDPKTSAILLYVEGVRDAPEFLSSLRGAARTKPVIVLKAGRHIQSSTAAHTHTGALIGNDAVFDVALARAGAVRAQTFGELFAAAEILSPGKRVRGNRLGIITNGGGAGVLAADRAGDLGIVMPQPSDKTLARLDAALQEFWSRANPIDILGDAAPEDFASALGAALEEPEFDGVLVMLTPQAMTDPTAAAQAVIDAIPERTRKPVLACWMGETAVSEGRTLLSASGIPDFNTPERAVEAFSYLAQHQRHRWLANEVPGPLHDSNPPDVDGARMIIGGVIADGREMLSDIESKALLRAFRIPINITIEAATDVDALIAAETVGYPVAVKINSPQIVHKSDVGGVRLGVASGVEVKQAFRDIVAGAKKLRPEARIKGVTVETMAHMDDARELVVGVSRDPVFGPVILFGAGGTMVEVLQDSAVSLPPLNEVLAERLINRTRVARLLEAFRDRPAVDRAAVIDVLLRISDMVCEMPQIVEMDINPLIAGPDGVLAVDARIRVARPPSRDGAYDHVAIHPYPRHLVRTEHLADGTTLTIRPIRPEDAESEAAFVRRMSPEAKRFRFMGTVNELSDEMLARFTQIDYRREMAMVAMVGSGGDEVQHGVARYTINPDNTSGEFAIAVSDELQGQGIGTRLMKALFAAARDHGLTKLEGSVLRENVPMLHLMEELGFTVTPDPDDRECVMVERWL